jgi:hypothetical protein
VRRGDRQVSMMILLTLLSPLEAVTPGPLMLEGEKIWCSLSKRKCCVLFKMGNVRGELDQSYDYTSCFPS